MSTVTADIGRSRVYPVRVYVDPSIDDRDRLTVAFRIILAIPHLLLVGGPLGITLAWTSSTNGEFGYDWGAGGGVLGAVAVVIALIGWFAIVFTGRYPDGLRALAVFYLRWRVRALSYTALLRDEYPPFGEGAYPARVELPESQEEHDRVGVAFRIILAIPQLLVVWVLTLMWAVTTLFAWFAILLTGRYPEPLYAFGVGVLRWNARVEAYLLLLTDDYPPFSLE